MLRRITSIFAKTTNLLFLLLFTFTGHTLRASEIEEIRIISTNDIHYYLRPLYYRHIDEVRPWGSQPRDGNYIAKAKIEGKIGGMAHVATAIEKLRSEKTGKSLVIDAGDTWHGSAFSLLDQGESMVKIMNTIGYDAMALGNWDFYYEEDHFLNLVEQCKFPVLAYNLVDKEWEEPVLEQYTVKQVGNLKVAIVGMTYPWTALTSAITGAARKYKFGIRENEAEVLIRQIRNEEDPDLVIFVSHGGYGLDQKFAKRVEGIDVIVSSHTHDEIFHPLVWNNTIIYQAGAHGKFVAKLDLRVKDKKVLDFDYQLVRINQNRIRAHPGVAKIIEQAYQPHQEKLEEIIGESKSMLYRRDYWQSTMGNLITAALQDSAKTDIAFFPAWRYGATILPGKITVGDVYDIVPTHGRIITYSMQGEQIKMLLENILGSFTDPDPYARVGGDMIRFAGLKIRYDLNRKLRDRIVSLQVEDQPIDFNKSYSIASVHTRFQNNPLFGATNIKDTGKIFVEELVQYIREHSPIVSEIDDRILSVR